MNVNHFKYIVEIAELGSISKAAETLFLSQPYLSRIIKDMEREMNIQIFNRSVGGMKLTSEGIQFLNKSKQILEQYDSLLDIHSNHTEEKKNSIVLSTIRSSLVMESFIHLIETYYDTNYEFTINELNSDMPIQDVTYLKADLGVIYMHKQNKTETMHHLQKNNIRYEKICNFNNCIIFGVHHPLAKNKSITLEELSEYGLVTYSNEHLPYQKHQGISDSLDSIIKSRFYNKIIYVNSRASLHNILTHTNFFSIGTQSAKSQEEKFKITSIPIDTLSNESEMEMGVIYRKSTNLHEVANSFVTILQKHYQL